MDAGRFLPVFIAFLGMLVNGAISNVRAEDPFASSGIPRGDTPRSGSSSMTRSSRLAMPISLETLPKSWQDSILKVMQQPNLTASAPLKNSVPQ